MDNNIDTIENNTNINTNTNININNTNTNVNNKFINNNSYNNSTK